MEELSQILPRIEKNIRLISNEKEKIKCSECGVEDDHTPVKKFDGICSTVSFPNAVEKVYGYRDDGEYDFKFICNNCQDRNNKKNWLKERVENIDIFLFEAGIRKRYLQCTLDNFKGGEKYVKFCKKWLENPKESLFLTGAFGCGKTHLAVALCRELAQKKELYKIEFQFSIDLLYEIKKTFNNEKKWDWQTDSEKPKDANGYIEFFSNPNLHFLILDDLGAEKSTEWAVETLSLIIDRRDRDMLPTIVTSNLSLEEIGEKISGRIASRLANGKIIKIDMPDYRLKR